MAGGSDLGPLTSDFYLHRRNGMRMRTLLTAALLAAAICSRGGANVNLVLDGTTDYCIVLSKDASPSEHWAASELKQFIYEMSGAMIPYCPDSTNPPEHAILVGESDASLSVPGTGESQRGPGGVSHQDRGQPHI